MKSQNYFLKMLKSIFKLLKHTFKDIGILFKNFIHWNFSKILIFVWGSIIAVLSTIPFFIIFGLYSLFSGDSFMNILNGLLTGTLLNSLFGNIILIIMLLIFFISFSYSQILIINLNSNYLEGKNLKYLKNNYLDFKRILKYFNLSFLSIGILFIPVLLFFILIGILFLIVGDVQSIITLISSGATNYFSVLSLIFLFISILLFLYLFYRIMFSFFIMTDIKNSKNIKKSFYYIKESFKITKGYKKIFKLLFIIILFSTITYPINYLGNILNNNERILIDYKTFSNLEKETQEYYLERDPYYYNGLIVEFGELDKHQLDGILLKNKVYIYLFVILKFIFISGVFLMLLSSFYKRELIKK